MLSRFNYKNKQFRSLNDTESNIWFCGKDSGTILEYANTRKAIQMHVDDEDKTTFIAVFEFKCELGSLK